MEEAKKLDEEFIGERVDPSMPHLIVLNEDPQLSHVLKYSLQTLPLYVGRKHGSPDPKIKLSGIGIKTNHAIFTLVNDEIVLKPNDPEALKYIFVNGKKIPSAEGVALQHSSRITFGLNSIFLYMEKSDGKDIHTYKWEGAQLELQKEIEKANKLKEEENEKRKQEEMKNYKIEMEKKFEKEKAKIEDKLRSQVEEYEKKITDLSKNAEKKSLEEERYKVELILQEKLKMLEAEKVKKRREYEMIEQNEKTKREKMLHSEDNLHLSKKLETTLQNIVRKVNKMTVMVSEMRRNFKISIKLEKDLEEYIVSDTRSNSTNILIRVENLEEGSVYYWNLETFQNRYDMTKELFDRYQDEVNFDPSDLPREEDPLWDEQVPVLIGYCFYKLEPVSYLISNPSTLSIISTRGQWEGSLEMDIYPHDEDGNEFDEVPDDPMELLGQPVNFRVVFEKISSLPENMFGDVYMEYSFFFEGTTNKTKVIQGPVVSAEIHEEFEHSIDYLTKEDIEYFQKGKLAVKIYGMELIERIGKISRNSLMFSNDLTRYR